MTVRPRAAVAVLGLALAACQTVELRFDDSHEPESDAGADAGPRPAVSAVNCLDGGICALAGLHCDATGDLCVECVDDSHCTGARPRCQTSTHRCIECVGATDCGSNGSCVPGVNRCARNCSTQLDCPPTAFECEGGHNWCTFCEIDADCVGSADGTRCDIAYGRCVECIGSGECLAARPICDRTRGRCSECLVSWECDAGLGCSPSAHRCVAP